ncbi:hypothetical protein BvCmsSINP017_02673 [Escherichia coli]|nr:hypothetical protein BvCms1485_03826 [Escherichia coli]GCO73472.1 hypothetical protein BvCms244_00728 [Escherichia coli]GDH37037.1 hypothetical protein BvCmsKKNP020_02567 [Escherichia coli]GDI90241.1 hypothetical protein BvCmsKKNP025_02632 [Escherichia coli]GDM79376.1 hypothetical protein BvCmsNSNP014_02436 [Escherichia coli]
MAHAVILFDTRTKYGRRQRKRIQRRHQGSTSLPLFFRIFTFLLTHPLNLDMFWCQPQPVYISFEESPV